MIRLHLFFARESSKAVILRQGPSKTFRMILWDRDDDSFEDGQWLKHKVYPQGCDLSPDGCHFLYFALNGDWAGETKGAYTAISRPPYFTALALFPEGDAWGGGGCFLDSRHYMIASRSFDILGRDDGLFRAFDGARRKGCPTGLRLIDGKPAPISKEVAARVDEIRRSRWTAPLDRYETQGGRLYRIVQGDLELIRDFSDMSFEPVRAPYDWRVGKAPQEPATWHPLDGEGI